MAASSASVTSCPPASSASRAAACTTAARSSPALDTTWRLHGYLALRYGDGAVHLRQRGYEHRSMAHRQACRQACPQGARAFQCARLVPGCERREGKEQAQRAGDRYATARLEGIPGDQRPVAPIKEGDVTGGVAWSCDDFQGADASTWSSSEELGPRSGAMLLH